MFLGMIRWPGRDFGGAAMRPRERWETGQKDLFRPRLEQMLDLGHGLVRLGEVIDWSFLERRFGAVYEDGPGRPPLATRLMAGLSILRRFLSGRLLTLALSACWPRTRRSSPKATVRHSSTRSSPARCAPRSS